MADRFTKRRRAKRRKIKKVMGICMAVLILALGGVLLAMNVRQVGVLQEEVSKILETSASGDALDMDIYSTGTYAVVEKTVKDYMNEYITNLREVTTFLDDEKFINMLTQENIQSDGPDFPQSKACLQEKKEMCDRDFARLKELATDENVDKTVREAGLESYYGKLCERYLRNLKENVMLTPEKFDDAYAQAADKISQREQILDFLISHKGAWHCEEGKITFETEQLSQEYNSLVESLTAGTVSGN